MPIIFFNLRIFFFFLLVSFYKRRWAPAAEKAQWLKAPALFTSQLTAWALFWTHKESDGTGATEMLASVWQDGKE